MVSEQDVRHVAELARLAVAPERLPQLAAQLDDILGHMAVLEQVDTEGIEPTAGVSSGGTPLRVDSGPKIPLLRELEAFAPAMRHGFFLVPRLASHEELGAADEVAPAAGAAEPGRAEEDRA